MRYDERVLQVWSIVGRMMSAVALVLILGALVVASRSMHGELQLVGFLLGMLFRVGASASGFLCGALIRTLIRLTRISSIAV
jgi:hypothetical protein